MLVDKRRLYELRGSFRAVDSAWLLATAASDEARNAAVDDDLVESTLDHLPAVDLM